jgi:hypothetical protein
MICQNWPISRFRRKLSFKRTHFCKVAQPDGLLLGAGRRRRRGSHGWRFPYIVFEGNFMKRALMNRMIVVVAAICLSMGCLQSQASACGGCGGCGFNLCHWFQHCCCASSCGSCSSCDSCSSCGSSTAPSCGCQKEEPSCGAPAEGAAPAAPAATPAPAAPAMGPST